MFFVGSGSNIGVLASSSGNGAGNDAKDVGAFATAAGRTTGLMRALFGGRTTGTTESSASALSAVDLRRWVGEGKQS